MKDRSPYIFLLPIILTTVYIAYFARNYMVFTLPRLANLHDDYGNIDYTLKQLIFDELTKNLAYYYIIFLVLGLFSILLLVFLVEKQKSRKFTLVFSSIMLTILIYGSINISYKSAYVLRDILAKYSEEGYAGSVERAKLLIEECGDKICLEGRQKEYLQRR